MTLIKIYFLPFLFFFFAKEEEKKRLAKEKKKHAVKLTELSGGTPETP
jgi:hypothetical protein